MLRPINFIYGADPEGFFSKDGTIIGSEKLLPKTGLKGGAINPHVVLDGVQFELNPPARSEISLFGREISTAFILLQRRLKKVGQGVTLDWRGLVEVGADELHGLSERSNVLGCSPSLNIYEDRPIKVDPTTYRKRSAGGHLHLGIDAYPDLMSNLGEIVPTLDIIVGNTLVLFDRDPGAAERRENYGRAGEYRTPAHGLEYRTPSNFWLRNFTLLSLSMGLAQIALAAFKDRAKSGGELIRAVGRHDTILEAINTNNFDLALENFRRIRPFLVKHLPPTGFVLEPESLGKFEVLVQAIRTSGLTSVFLEEPMAHWVSGAQVPFTNFVHTMY